MSLLSPIFKCQRASLRFPIVILTSTHKTQRFLQVHVNSLFLSRTSTPQTAILPHPDPSPPHLPCQGSPAGMCVILSTEEPALAPCSPEPVRCATSPQDRDVCTSLPQSSPAGGGPDQPQRLSHTVVHGQALISDLQIWICDSKNFNISESEKCGCLSIEQWF